MRSDMAKTVIDCYRNGPRLKQPKGYKKRDKIDENSPKMESIRKKWKQGYNQKQSGEHLQPLFRFLLSCVGRLWNDVYSEMRSILKADSAIQSHVMDHANWMIEKNVTVKGNAVYDYHGFRLYWSHHNQLYIHPTTGILSLLPKENKSSLRKDPLEYVQIAQNKYMKINGIWYQVEYSDKPSSIYYCSRQEFLSRLNEPTISIKTDHKWRTKRVIIKSKRQLNKKEIKSLKLNEYNVKDWDFKSQSPTGF